MGVEYPTYAGHENGARGFGNEAKRYATFFRVRLEWLLEGAGAEKSNPLEEAWARLTPEAQRDAMAYLEFLEAKARKAQ